MKCTGFESPLGTSRRQLLQQFGMGLGSIALADLVNPSVSAAATPSGIDHAPRAKRVIFLFQAGGPSQIDMFDHKPELNARHGSELPDEIRGTQRLTGMSGNQASLPLVGSPFKFQQYGESGATVSELLPHTAAIADDLCFIKSVHTEAINHGPGVTFIQTGAQIPGRPSMGAWLSYGLGTDNENLPSFVVLVTKDKGGQPLAARLWGSGFLPAQHQGVQFRSGGDPVLYLNNPAGVDRASRRAMLDTLRGLHEMQIAETSDPAIEARIAQHELAFRMQASVPEATNFADESQQVIDSYGPDAKNPGTFAANCLLARRLAERGVRFIQLYHQGWDQHGGLPGGIKRQCSETDQPAAALVQDLKRCGLLEDTLVVWAGEFGRTNYCQGKLSATNFGRDHHPRCFTIWMAGGGIKPGITHGHTDDFSYNVTENPVHIHDLQATILHQLGIDHERLTFRYQGRRFRLTDVHGHVIKPILA
ncbi:hypothetical protein Poly24_26860 [Rosistilla carotiformis]|uniref:Sulfatase n=1 Tax=Rosistilla carotiformis TaxID=2528017 RepID=A0A518JTV2_9BACT|nr:hypothetical protein Poly24_26860 [Rosistilla carotiformis]